MLGHSKKKSVPTKAVPRVRPRNVNTSKIPTFDVKQTLKVGGLAQRSLPKPAIVHQLQAFGNQRDLIGRSQIAQSIISAQPPSDSAAGCLYITQQILTRPIVPPPCAGVKLVQNVTTKPICGKFLTFTLKNQAYDITIVTREPGSVVQKGDFMATGRYDFKIPPDADILEIVKPESTILLKFGSPYRGEMSVRDINTVDFGLLTRKEATITIKYGRFV